MNASNMIPRKAKITYTIYDSDGTLVYPTAESSGCYEPVVTIRDIGKAILGKLYFAFDLLENMALLSVKVDYFHAVEYVNDKCYLSITDFNNFHNDFMGFNAFIKQEVLTKIAHLNVDGTLSDELLTGFAREYSSNEIPEWMRKSKFVFKCKIDLV